MFAILALAVVLSGAGCCVFGLVLGAFGGLVVDLWSSVVGVVVVGFVVVSGSWCSAFLDAVGSCLGCFVW